MGKGEGLPNKGHANKRGPSLDGEDTGSQKDPSDGVSPYDGTTGNDTINERDSPNQAGQTVAADEQGNTVKEAEKGSLKGSDKGSVKGNDNGSIKGTEKGSIKGKDTESIKGKDTESIKGKDTESIKGKETESLKGKDTESIKGNDTESIKGNDNANIKGLDSTSIKGSEKGSIQGKDTDSIKGNDNTSIKASEKGSIKETANDNKRGNDNASLKGNDEGDIQVKDRESVKGNDNESAKGNDNESIKGSEKGSTKERDRDSIKGSERGSIKRKDTGSIKENDNVNITGSQKGSIRESDNEDLKENDKDIIRGSEKGSIKEEDLEKFQGNDRGSIQGNEKGSNRESDKDSTKDSDKGSSSGNQRTRDKPGDTTDRERSDDASPLGDNRRTKGGPRKGRDKGSDETDDASSGRSNKSRPYSRKDSSESDDHGSVSTISSNQKKVYPSAKDGQSIDGSHRSSRTSLRDITIPENKPGTYAKRKDVRVRPSKPVKPGAHSRRTSIDDGSSVSSHRTSNSSRSTRDESPAGIKESIVPKKILFLVDAWSSTREGITGINYNLACSMARFRGIEIYCAVLQIEKKVNYSDRKEAHKNGISLIFPTLQSKYRKSMSHAVKLLNSEPGRLYANFFKRSIRITQIVGHDPISANAAKILKELFYPAAKVIIMFHNVPTDVQWMNASNTAPVKLPSEEQCLDIAEKADVVFCVGKTTHDYYTAFFRNHASKKIDHRIFWPRYGDKVFKLPRQPTNWRAQEGRMNLLILNDGYGVSAWSGIDIAASITEKLTLANHKRSEDFPITTLTIAEGAPDGDFSTMLREIGKWLKTDEVSIKIVDYQTPDKFYECLSTCDLCIVPCRGEPFGMVGLLPLCAGVPTLVSENSATVDIIKKASQYPDLYTVPVTKNQKFVRQDATVWKDRILEVMKNPEAANERAEMCRTALKKDEHSKLSYDNFLSYCVGGIRIKFFAKRVQPINTTDPCEELTQRRKLNDFIFETIQSIWRLKRHPMLTQEDARPTLGTNKIDLPWDSLRRRVLHKLEEREREVIEIDKDQQAFLVYCPTLDSLWDLWCMCDVLNERLVDALFLPGNVVFQHFRLLDAQIFTEISGPEFLKYKQEILYNSAND